MGQPIRLTKPEREAVLDMLESQHFHDKTTRWVKALNSAVVKIKASADPKPPKPRAGISCDAAITCFRGVLGARLVIPPSPGPGYWPMVQRALATNGYTPEQCEKLAAVAAVKWTGKIKLESLARQGAVLLSEGLDMDFDGEMGAKTDEDESWRLI